MFLPDHRGAITLMRSGEAESADYHSALLSKRLVFPSSPSQAGPGKVAFASHGCLLQAESGKDRGLTFCAFPPLPHKVLPLLEVISETKLRCPELCDFTRVM